MKKTAVLFITILLQTTVSVFAQKDTAFIYTFGGDKDEQGRAIELTLDSGYIMVGATSSFGAGNSDIYIVKVNGDIEYQWSAAIGHQYTEFGQAVKQTPDSGYVICGYTNSIGNGGYDAYLIKIDKKGDLLWEKTFGGFDWDFAYDLELTADGSIIIIGETYSFGNGSSDAYLIKTDKNGDLLWEKTLGGKGKDAAHGLTSTLDGNYAFCGENASKNPENKGDAWVVKFNANGDTLVTTCLDLPEFESANDIIETKTQDLVIIGVSFSENILTSDILTASFSYKGNYNWHAYYGAVYQPTIENDVGYGIDLYENGNLLITGSSLLGNGGENVYTGMFDGSNGSYITAPSYGGSKNEIGYDCLIKPGQGELFLSTGESESNGYSDMQLISVDTVDGNKVLVYFNIEDSNIKNIKTPLSNESKIKNNILKVFPNPTSNTLFFKLIDGYVSYNLFFSNGVEVRKLDSSIHSNYVCLDIEQLPSGLYFLKIITKSGYEIFSIFKE